MVGRVVLPLRFNPSQALCVCLVVFQVCKRVLAVFYKGWILCKTFELMQSQAKVTLTNWM